MREFFASILDCAPLEHELLSQLLLVVLSEGNKLARSSMLPVSLYRLIVHYMMHGLSLSSFNVVWIFEFVWPHQNNATLATVFIYILLHYYFSLTKHTLTSRNHGNLNQYCLHYTEPALSMSEHKLFFSTGVRNYATELMAALCRYIVRQTVQIARSITRVDSLGCLVCQTGFLDRKTGLFRHRGKLFRHSEKPFNSKTDYLYNQIDNPDIEPHCLDIFPDNLTVRQII